MKLLLPQNCFIVKSTSDKEPYYLVAFDDNNITTYPVSRCIFSGATEIDNGMRVKIEGYMETAGYIEEIKPVLTAYPQSKDPVIKNLNNFNNLMFCFDLTINSFMHYAQKSKTFKGLNAAVKSCCAGLTDCAEKISKENDIEFNYGPEGTQLGPLQLITLSSHSISELLPEISKAMPAPAPTKLDYIKQHIGTNLKQQTAISAKQKRETNSLITEVNAYATTMLSQCTSINNLAHQALNKKYSAPKETPRTL